MENYEKKNGRFFLITEKWYLCPTDATFFRTFNPGIFWELPPCRIMTEILQMPKMFVKGKNIWTLPVSTSKKMFRHSSPMLVKIAKIAEVLKIIMWWFFWVKVLDSSIIWKRQFEYFLQDCCTSDAKNCIFWAYYFWVGKINIATICYSWMQKKNLSSDRCPSHFVSLNKPAKMWQIEMFIFRP